ncbi:MAG: hypothetical protein HOK41_00710 [Nitrospina sp.]|jgi:outer membrane protein assembly factor BamB|nr:hypothetical protein [Nitrospina sp.]MBT6717421.1 hypothetical protein [Nitrospina sp.]
MKKILTELLIIFLLILVSQNASAFKVGGLQNPESVIVDPATGVYYISGHTQTTGFIWKVDATGKRAIFLEGGKNGIVLNAPKGLAISGDQLYVADGKSIYRFNKTTGASLGIIDLLGIAGNSLQDLVFGNEGQLFVSDGPRNAIYKIDTRNAFNVSILARSPNLGFPTGIAFDMPRNRLIVLSRHRILSVSMEGGITSLVNGKFKSLYGVDWDRQGNLLVSDRGAGKVYRIRNFSFQEIVRQNILDPSGISFDYAHNQMLISSGKGRLVFSLPLK